MANSILTSLKRSRVVNYLRNYILLKPSIYVSPKSKEVSVSDFFFWNCQNSFQTKFYITNLASQILPNISQNDHVKILIFDNHGSKIDEISFSLDPFETKEFIFQNDKYKNKYGSFFIFHKFENLGDLISNGCHVAERGYTGYRVGDGVWNFVHGNHYSASLTSNNEIESLVSRSFFKTSYKMQVSFNDSNKQELVVNNPDKKEAKLDFLYFDSEMNYLGKESIILNSLSTMIYNLDKYKFKYIEIKSNIIFCRPLVIKYYDTYFDVFHA